MTQPPDPVRPWDAPWVRPTGSAPEREPGAPSFGALALLHLGVFFGLSSLAGLVAPFASDSESAGAATYAVLAVLTLIGGGYSLNEGRTRDSRLYDWTADLLLSAGALYTGAAAGLTAAAGGRDSFDNAATGVAAGALTTAVVAGGAYVLLRRAWLQLTTVAALAVGLIALNQREDGLPAGLIGVLLLVLAGLVLAGARVGGLRPVSLGYVNAAVIALAGSQVLLAGDDSDLGLGYAVSVVVLVAVGWGIAQIRSASILPVALLGGIVLLPQVLSPLLGGGYAFGLSVLGIGVAVAWLSADVVRRSVRPVHTGGTFLVCTVLVLISAPILAAAGNDLTGLLASAGVAAFFAAAASVRRRPATVLSGLLLVVMAPATLAAPLGDSDALAGLLGLACIPLVVLAAIQLDRRAPRPASSPYAQEQALAGAGETFTLVAAYPVVFDAIVGLLGGAGLPLQLVDRAGGRIVAGEAAAPIFVIAVWAADPVRTHLRVAGAPLDVSRFQADLQSRVTAGPAARY